MILVVVVHKKSFHNKKNRAKKIRFIILVTYQKKAMFLRFKKEKILSSITGFAFYKN